MTTHTRFLQRHSGLVGALLLFGAAVGAVAVPTAASAATDCSGGQSSAWTNTTGGAFDDPLNWSNGVPGGDCDASIVASGTYTVVIRDGRSVHSLTLGGTSGTQTLQLLGSTSAGGDPLQAYFSVAGDQTISVGTHGAIQLTSVGANPGAAILGGGTLVNSGRVTTDPGASGPSTFRDIRADVTNNAGGTIAFNADTSSCSCGSGGTWINNGTLTTAAGTHSLLSRTGAGVHLSQTAATGTIANAGHLAISGAMTNTAGGTSGNPVEVCGDLSAPSPKPSRFAFAQRSLCNGWALTSDIGAATTVLVRDSEANGSITVTVPTDLTNKGVLTLDAIAGGNQVQLVGSGSARVTNDGTINVVQPGSSLLTAPLVNHGTVHIGGANSLEVRGPITQTAGTLTIDSGGTLSTGQAITLGGGTIANAGTLTTSGAFTHTGGTTSGRPIQICGGTINASGSGKAGFLLVRTDACGYPTIGSDIAAGNTIEVQASSMTADTFFGTIVNHGTLRLDGDQTNQLHGTMLTNDGTFALDAGVGNMAMNLVNHATMTIAKKATMNVGNPVTLGGGTFVATGALNANSVTQSAGTTTVTGTATIADYALTGGTLQGTGTITSSNGVSNTGATVRPGNPRGTLHIAGNYSQGTHGTLALSVASAAANGYSHLAVTGTASLAGSLRVSSAASITKALKVVTAPSVTGTFAKVADSGWRYRTTYAATGVTLTPVAQALTRVSLAPATIKTGKTSSAHFTVAQPGTVKITVTRSLAGHLVHGTCSLKATSGARCHVIRTYLTKVLTATAGAHAPALAVSKLAPAHYTVTVAVRTASGTLLRVTRTLVVNHS